MFGWFTRRKPAPLLPESLWQVALGDGTLAVTDDHGQTRSLCLDALTRVAVETNDSGPWGADVWWLFFTDGSEHACAFPQGATGEAAAIGYISALPDFDHGAMIRAMQSADNASFPLWRKT